METIYGVNPVKEVIATGKRKIFEVLVARERYDEIAAMLENVPINWLSRKELDRIAKTPHHQGVIAKVSPYHYADIYEMMDLDVVLLLDTVEDPQNLGAIIRSAYALAGAGIIITEDRSASITPTVLKSSAGACEHAQIARVVNLRQAAKELKKAGFWLIGLEAHAKQGLCDAPEYDKIALVMGGEDSGIRPVIAKELDLLVSIPMHGGFNSLNVAQSATVALYEMVVSRRKKAR